MTHGDEPKDPPEHGTKHLGDELQDAHGHDAHGHGQKLSFEVIPEASAQDKFLIVLAFVGLVGWLIFAYEMLSAPQHEAGAATHAAGEAAPTGEHHAQ